MMAVAKPFIRCNCNNSLKTLHIIVNCISTRTVESGAQTTIYCAVDEKIAEHNGRLVLGTGA